MPLEKIKPKNRIEELSLEVKTLMQGQKYDPLLELISAAQDPDLSPTEKNRIHMKLLEFRYPALKSVDVNANVTASVNVSLVQFADLDPEDMVQTVVEVPLIEEEKE